MSRFIKIVKKAGEYFTVAAGAVSLVVAVVGAFVVVSATIAIPVAVGAGLIVACIGARSAYRDLQSRDARRAQRRHAINELHEMKIELDEIKNGLAHRDNPTVDAQPAVVISPSANASAFFAVATPKQDDEFQRKTPSAEEKPANSSTFPVSCSARVVS